MKKYNWKTIDGTITISKKSLSNPEELTKTFEEKYTEFGASILKALREYVYGEK